MKKFIYILALAFVTLVAVSSCTEEVVSPTGIEPDSYIGAQHITNMPKR